MAEVNKLNLNGSTYNLRDSEILNNNSVDIFHIYCETVTGTNKGVTYTWANDVCTVTGSLSSTGITSNALLNSITEGLGGVNAGDIIHIFYNTTSDEIKLNVMTYTNGASTGGVNHFGRNGEDVSFIVPDGISGFFIRLQTNGDTTTQFNDTVSNIKIYKSKSNGDLEKELNVINFVTTNDQLDRSPEVNAILAEHKRINFGEGRFYLAGINMPDDSIITGQGSATKIYLKSNEGNYIFKLGSRCTIKNLAIYANTDDYTSNNSTYPTDATIGTKKAIVWEGTYNTDSSTPKRAIVEGCYIANFDNSGIYLNDTGTNVVTGISVSNCIIWHCYAGININYSSEFNRFVNCAVSNCLYGVINNGGNNHFSNSVFAKNNTGMLIDNGTGQSPNRGHGTVQGCNFDHAGGNTGFGVEIYGNTYGEIFTGCQFFYSGIKVSESDGIVFANCLFGRGSDQNGEILNVTNGGLLLFDGCALRHSFNKTLNGTTHVVFANSYLWNGNAVTQ